MKKSGSITTLLLDIGDVLLNDGWDHNARKRAAMSFKLKLSELNDRHHLVFETYEQGKLTLKEYLDLVVFYEKRSFTPNQFRKFMFAQSKPYPEMIELIRRLKAKYGMKIVAVSNEGRELNEFRIHKFKLNSVIDFFISSCFVHIRKPDVDIFRLALEFIQTPACQVLYIENTPMFTEVAESFGIRSILHTNYKSTYAKLVALGLDELEGR